MKHIYTFTLTILLLAQGLIIMSQSTYAFNPNSNKIYFVDVDECSIEGYNGTEILIESDGFEDNDDKERVKGLRLVNSQGLGDNSGLGLSIENGSDMITVKSVKKNSCGSDRYFIRIPKSMDIIYEHSNYNGDDLEINNVSGELDISTNYNDIYLDNVTGPMAVKTVYGSIEANFNELSPNGSITLYSVYEYLELSIPNSANTNLNVNSSYGNFYSDMDIKVNSSNKKLGDFAGTEINGSTNGGGVDLNLTSTYENIYLRAK